MKSSSTLKNNITSIAIGGFDGLHLAHQELFKHLKDSGAIVVIESGYSNLTPKNYRKNFTKLPIFFYDLKEIKHLSAEKFLDILLKDFPKLELIVVGYDFAFGANRSHNAKDLERLFKKIKNGKTIIVNEIKIDNISVHSKIIREYLKNGDIELANKLLSREYEIEGKVIKGQGLGKKEFVPTINIDVKEFLLPKEGVYKTKTIIDNKEYLSISFLGHRKTTDNSFAIETHLIDVDNIKLNSSNIKIKFIKKVRDNIKFDSFSKLKKQIIKDIDFVKKSKT